MAELYSADQAFKAAIEHFQARRFEEAEHILRQLVAVASDHDSLMYLLGLSCCHLGKIEEGAVWLRKTLELNPTHATAYLNLGVALFKLGCLAEAEDSLRSALGIDPQLLMGWDVLKQIAASKGDWPSVMRSMERMVALSTEQSEYLKTACLYIVYLVDSDVATIPNILEVMRDGTWARPDLFTLYAPLLEGNLPEHERREKVFQFRKDLDNLHQDGWSCLHLVLLWRHLFNLGWSSTHLQPEPVCLPEHVENAIRFSGSTRIIDGILRYKLNSPREWNERLFNEYIVPLAKKFHESRSYWALRDIGALNDMAFAQQPHTEQQARYCYDALKPYYVAAGDRLLERWGSAELPSGRFPVVAFHSEWDIKVSAPNRVVMFIVKGWHESILKAFVPLVIGFSRISKEIRDFLDACGVKYLDMSDLRGKGLEEDHLEPRLHTLRKELESHNVTALVDYGSSDGFSSLLAASRIAPVQVYFSMGFHYMDGPGWDAFFCLGSAGETSRTYDGRIWRAVTLSQQDPRVLPGASEQVDTGREIRAKRFSSQSVVLGAIARPQKLNNEEFLTALARILTRNGNAVFLWFGDKELETVRQRMIALGISGQCLFEGYQNASAYAQVMDIHLDPFPYPSGLSIRDTMCYGVPSVSMITRDAQRAGVVSQILPMLRRKCGTEEQQETMRGIFTDSDTGESLALLANSMDEYVALTQQLIDDPVFRKKVGHAGQRFMETFLLDPKICYESFSRQILEVIEGKKEMMQREGLARPLQ